VNTVRPVGAPKVSRISGRPHACQKSPAPRRDTASTSIIGLRLLVPSWGHFANKNGGGYAEGQRDEDAVTVTRADPNRSGRVPKRSKIGYHWIPKRLEGGIL